MVFGFQSLGVLNSWRCHGSADQELAGTMRGGRKSYPYTGLASEKGEEGNGSRAWGDR